jgi:hypothetical protein
MTLKMETNLILGEGKLCQLLCFLFVYFPFSACLSNTVFVTRHILLYLKYSFFFFCRHFVTCGTAPDGEIKKRSNVTRFFSV